MKRNVGKLSRSADRSGWVIEGPPHLLMRAKRLFEGASKAAVGQINVSHSDERCRDLLWMLDRYPLEVSQADMVEIRAAADRFDSRLEQLELILADDYEPPTFEFAVPPRRYQAQAAAVYTGQGYLLLADDLGLGKTFSGICSYADKRTLPGLVVCQPHLQTQWKNQIAKFAPHLTVHIIEKQAPYDLPLERGRLPDVVIITYNKLDRWQDALARYVRSIIWDEVQELRRRESAKYKAAENLANVIPFRLGLTATPIYNYGGEIYAVVNVIAPGALGTWDEFYREHCVGFANKASLKDPKSFGSYLREQGLMLRRTRQDVGRELPPVVRVVHEVEADARALENVDDKASELARIILDSAAVDRGEKMQASQELSNLLRQATGIAKAPYVAEFVKLLASSGEPIVLCGWHRAVYDIWKHHLRDLRVVMYTGEESAAQKDEARRKLMDGEADVFILSLRAGAGLDGLQGICRNMVFGELDWAKGVEEQCIGRLHRDGQAETVNAYFLISSGGTDPLMCRVLGLKRDQAEGIRNPTSSEIEELVRDGNHIKELARQYITRGRKVA